MLFLLQDGITNGAIYALLGLALVLVFAVTRVILIPQGEFVTYGALSYAVLATGQVPGTAWLAMAMGMVAFALDLFDARRSLRLKRILRALALNIVLPAAILALTYWPGRAQDADRGQHRAVAADRRGDRTVPLPHRVPAARPHLGAGAADRLRRLPSRAAGPGPGVLRRRGPARPGAVQRRADARAAALHRPEPCGLRLTIAFIVALWLFFGFTLIGKALRATAVNRLGARLVGIRTTLSGQIAFLLASVIGAISGILIVPITTLYYDTGFLIGLKGFIAAIIGGLVSYPLTAVAALIVGMRRGVLLVLCQQLQGGHRLHADPSRAGAAFARSARGRGREGLTAMHQRLPVLIFALVMAAIPFIPGVPPFWIVLLDNIGLAALVAMGLVLLTGVGGLTSFGQAAFCGFGAYTTAVLTTAYGVSPWLTLPLSLVVSGIAAVLLGIVTVRLSGHYLPLGTIAWGIGAVLSVQQAGIPRPQ